MTNIFPMSIKCGTDVSHIIFVVFTHSMSALREKCSPKWATFTLKTSRKFLKTCLVEVSFRNDFRSGWRNFQLRIGWWCYFTPVSSISCLNIDLCQHFYWPKNVNKPNLVFLHILEWTIRNTLLTNIIYTIVYKKSLKKQKGQQKP
jgi:hypothetical protein